MLEINSPATYATAIDDFCETFNEEQQIYVIRKTPQHSQFGIFIIVPASKFVLNFNLTVKEQNNYINVILIKLFFLKFEVLSCALFCNVGPL